MTETPWWDPARHADRRPLLAARGRIQRAFRGWLEAEGFTEVDPAALAASPGNEAHLHGFATDAIGNDGQARRLYLHTSPEFAMKKLLAAGETRIAAFAHVWRNRERGPLHSPEFTMLEWYRVGEPYETLMEDCTALLALAATASGASELRFRDHLCNPFAVPERLSVTEAFQRHAGIDLLATVGADGATDRDALAGQARAAGCGWPRMTAGPTSCRASSSPMSSRIWAMAAPPFSTATRRPRRRWPPRPDDPRVAERFELYACGVELANGFGELTDPAEQRRRFQAEMAEKSRVYGETYPLDEDLLAALAIMPPSSGIALGFDRLVMLATAAPRIEDVMWTPVP